MASRAIVTPLTLTVTGFPAGNWTCTEQDMRLLRRDWTAARNCFAPAIAAHDLIAAPAEVPDRRAPDVHKTGEREDEEERHPEEQMRLEDRMRVRDEVGDAGLQRENSLRPGHELDHLMTIKMVERNADRRKPEDKLRIKQQEDRYIAKGRGLADPRVE